MGKPKKITGIGDDRQLVGDRCIRCGSPLIYYAQRRGRGGKDPRKCPPCLASEGESERALARNEILVVAYELRKLAASARTTRHCTRACEKSTRRLTEIARELG
jgi:hypothetical protein